MNFCHLSLLFSIVYNFLMLLHQNFNDFFYINDNKKTVDCIVESDFRLQFKINVKTKKKCHHPIFNTCHLKFKNKAIVNMQKIVNFLF